MSQELSVTSVNSVFSFNWWKYIQTSSNNNNNNNNHNNNNNNNNLYTGTAHFTKSDIQWGPVKQ